MRSPPIVAMTVATALLALCPNADHAAAAADEAPFFIGPRPIWLVLGGATAGGTVAAKGGGAFVGGELSIARAEGEKFVGLYADGYHDFGNGGRYVSAGPELGVVRRSRTFPAGIGVDGGAIVRFGGVNDLGATGRVFVSLVGALSVYGRYAFFDAPAERHVIQVGVTWKFPLAAPFGAGAP